MIPFRLRFIREINRIYSAVLRALYYYTPHAPVIYLFHDIKETKADVISDFTLSQQSFEQFLLSKLTSGSTPMTFGDLSAFVNQKKPLMTESFAVSFDDANESVFINAYPFLKRNKIPFIIFITKELIGKPNFLKEEQIRILSADPLCTIGSHAMHHKMFRSLTKDEIKLELKDSKIFLEALTGKEIVSFAFPYGRLVETSCNSISLLKSSDYSFGFSAIPGSLKQKWLSSKYYLPRINVNEKLVTKYLCD